MNSSNAICIVRCGGMKYTVFSSSFVHLLIFIEEVSSSIISHQIHGCVHLLQPLLGGHEDDFLHGERQQVVRRLGRGLPIKEQPAGPSKFAPHLPPTISSSQCGSQVIVQTCTISAATPSWQWGLVDYVPNHCLQNIGFLLLKIQRQCIPVRVCIGLLRQYAAGSIGARRQPYASNACIVYAERLEAH